jgi:anti-sigma-K factor RskA
VTTSHEPFAELAAGWALGTLDRADAARFEAHVAEGCPECEQAVRDYTEALARTAADVAEPPPARVRAELVRRVAPARRPVGVRLVAGWAASLALAAGIAAVVAADRVSRTYEPQLAAMARESALLRDRLAEQLRTVADLQRRVDEQERTLTLVHAEATEDARIVALLNDPGTRVVGLAGLAPSPAAQARVLWNARGGGLLVTSDLPPTPPGKTYELWAIAGGTPRPAGVFGVDAAGHATMRVEPIAGVAQVDVFAVTLEPEGGVPSPTGAMFLASKSA